MTYFLSMSTILSMLIRYFVLLPDLDRDSIITQQSRHGALLG